MKRTTLDLHKKWMKNPRYRREYEALEEEFFARGRTDRRPSPRRSNARTGGTAYEDHPGRGSASGRRKKHALDANSRKIREGNGHAAQNHF